MPAQTEKTVHLKNQEEQSENFQGRRYGRCLICSCRMYSGDSYVTTAEGYCCDNCLKTIKQ